MAAPVAAKITLPSDGGNGGPILQTQTEVISAEARHVHFFIQRSKRKLTGSYRFAMAVQSVVTTAHDGTATGFFWLQLPAASAVRARLRSLQIAFAAGTTTVAPTIPRIALAKFTFTGTASGTEVLPALARTGDDAPIGHLRTAVTGMTVTVGNLAWATIVPGIFTGVGWAGGPVAEYRASSEEDVVDIASGEGLLLYQPDTGTASDPRRFSCSGAWDEYDSS